MPEHQMTIQRVAELLDEGSAEAAGFLREIAANASAKAERKQARRALYLLGQRGISPPPGSDELVVRRSAPARAADRKAFASAFDGAGNRLFIFYLGGSDGGTPWFVQFLINDEQGVIGEITSARMTRRQIAEQMDRAAAEVDDGLAIAEIEFDYALWLLDQARAINREKCLRTPDGFLDWRRRLGDPVSDYPRCPVWDSFDVVSLRGDSLAAGEPEPFFELPWFEPWFFDEQAVQPWLIRRVESLKSLLLIPDAVKQQRMERADVAALEALMPPRVRSLYVRRLEESADILRRCGREEPARHALVQALELSSVSSIADSRFARVLLERSMTATAELLQVQPRHEGET